MGPCEKHTVFLNNCTKTHPYFPWPGCQPPPSTHNCTGHCWWCWGDLLPSGGYDGECWWHCWL